MKPKMLLPFLATPALLSVTGFIHSKPVVSSSPFFTQITVSTLLQLFFFVCVYFNAGFYISSY